MTLIRVCKQKPKDFSPKVEIAAIYVNVDGRLLFLKLSHKKSEAGSWGVPAGKLEVNESPLKGAKRELFEETGIVVIPDKSFQVLGKLYVSKSEIDYIYHAFILDLDEQTTIHLSDEHSSYKWVSKDEAERLHLMTGAKEALDFYYQYRLKNGCD